MRLLFPVVEVTRLLSNVIKGGFVAFADDNRLVIDSNSSFQDTPSGRIIRSVEEQPENIEDLELEDILADEDYQDAAFQEKKAFADILIEDARTKADQLLAEARDEAARMMEQAKKEGYQEGYREGEKKAKQEASVTLQADREAVEEERKRLVRELTAEKELFLHEAEPRMADIVSRLITHLTGIVVKGQRNVLTYMIDCAMRGIEDSMNFVIKVSEPDYDWVMKHKDKIYGAGNPSISIEIFADAKLSKNQCFIETDNGIVNCSLDEQLHNLTRDIKLLSGME